MGAKAVGDTLAWIRASAISLASVEAGNGFADLEPLRTWPKPTLCCNAAICPESAMPASSARSSRA
jgi:hypothetical protein